MYDRTQKLFKMTYNRTGGRVALISMCVLSCLMALTAWEEITRGKGAATAVRTSEFSTVQIFQRGGKFPTAAPAQANVVAGSSAFKYYWVGNSTVPGAGLGVFAQQDIPAGTIWNPEDALAEFTLALRKSLWQSLSGFVAFVKAAGLQNPPAAALWWFMETYGYVCDDQYIVSLSGTTFVNHAPEPVHTSSFYRPGATVSRRSGTIGPAHNGEADVTLQRLANSGEPVPNAKEAQSLSYWQICTVSASLRDIRAGEEMLEDYTRYGTPCEGSSDCPDFLREAIAQGDIPADWNRFLPDDVVQLDDVYVANRSDGMGGGLGVFAARDLPEGTVWNQEDAQHSYAITRGQWINMLSLQQPLRALQVSRPVIDKMIDDFRTHGVYCPQDDRMYLSFTTSLFARRVSNNPTGGQEPGDMSKQNQDPGTSVQMRVAGVKGGVQRGAADAVHCTGLYSVGRLRKGDEIVVGRTPQLECDWPGMQE